jgi:hypothetical protein
MRANTQADQIREYVKNHYIDQARQRGETMVRIVAGDVHRELRLHNRVPNVCQVLRSGKFLRENNLVLERPQGPPSGLSTTVTFTYRFADDTANPQKESLFLGLRGIAKETFAGLGGGEEFIRNERESFYRHEENR